MITKCYRILLFLPLRWLWPFTHVSTKSAWYWVTSVLYWCFQHCCHMCAKLLATQSHGVWSLNCWPYVGFVFFLFPVWCLPVWMLLMLFDSVFYVNIVILLTAFITHFRMWADYVKFMPKHNFLFWMRCIIRLWDHNSTCLDRLISRLTCYIWNER